jgi:PAS domain S-box-containing protein
MSNSKSTEADFPGLRKKAEDELKTGKKMPATGTAPETEHELNVHKIELEMQNEELLSIQSKLISSIEEYAEIFGNAPVGFFITDKNGVIINVNQTGIDLLGIEKNKITGKAFSFFISSALEQDNFYRFRNLVIESRSVQHIECELKKGDGTLFYALVEYTTLRDENEHFKYSLLTVSDITERKEHERGVELALIREQELNELKSRFITIASHEFRTPLAAILLSIDLLQRYSQPGDDDKREKHFRKIKTAVNRLREILTDFLSASELEKGKLKNNPEDFNITDFIENLLEEVKSFNGIHNVVYSHYGKYKEVHLDKKLLKICLTNLVINAFKYSPNGGKITISTEHKTPELLKIKIADEGIGIPEADQSHIFETFFRARNAENVEGTGMGLNIAKRFITLMGGRISFVSIENKGTTFTIDFHNKKTL